MKNVKRIIKDKPVVYSRVTDDEAKQMVATGDWRYTTNNKWRGVKIRNAKHERKQQLKGAVK